MATKTFVDKAIIAVLGPIKLEIVELTAVSDGDTFTSRLQNPRFALAFNDGDASGNNGISAAVSGRTVTIHDPDITTVVAFVVGF